MYYSYETTPEAYDLGIPSTTPILATDPQSYDALFPLNYENIENTGNIENLGNVENYGNVENLGNYENIDYTANIQNIENYENVDYTANIQNIENLGNIENVDYNYYAPEQYNQTPITPEQYLNSQPEPLLQNYAPDSDPLLQSFVPQFGPPQNNVSSQNNILKPPQKIENLEKSLVEKSLQEKKLSEINLAEKNIGVPDIPQPKFSINPSNVKSSYNTTLVNSNNQSIFPEPTKSVYLPENNFVENKLKSTPPVNNISEKEKIQAEIEEMKLKKFSTDYDINSHFQLSISEQQPNIFKFLKFKKIAKPLLAHYEFPENYEYTSPLLSQNNLYLSCIAKNNNVDIVYIWDMSDLYNYKYKYDCLKVDSVAFTPDSNNIIIIYKNKNPVMYKLSDGKQNLELKSNGEENNRNGYNYAFTIMGNHFGYCSDKSFTLWSLRTGNIKLQILDNSPIKFIMHNFLVCISDELNCKIIKLENEETLIEFKIKGIENYKEILDVKCSDDMSYLIYVIKQGIIKYDFKEKEYKGVQKFTSDVEKAIISDDAKLVLKTNMRNISIYNIEKQEILTTILKEKFKEIRVDFPNKKLLFVDNISINIQDFENEDAPEKNVWLNKNPFNFVDVKFNNDFSLLLARIDRNNAIAYNLKTGKIIKKWQNIDDNWLDFSITSLKGKIIATKSNFFLIKVYDYSFERDKNTFYGFDSYSLFLSENGKYLACGTKKGPEIARIWDIKNNNYGTFPYMGENSNLNTVVNLTFPEPNKLICCSIGQQPLIFDTNSKQLLYKCECIYKLEEIYEIKSDQKYDIFLVKGRDINKKNIGLLYKISDGSLIEVFENYSIMELSNDFGIIITKSDNINQGKLTSIDYKNLSEPVINTFEKQNETGYLLNDKKTLVCLNGQSFNETEYILSDIENGAYIGKINFLKKTDRSSQEYLTVDDLNNELVFRYYELLSPEETMEYKKKKLFW